MTTKDMYSTSETAKILRLSRVEVFRKIKAGKIRAEKVGRNYVIPYDSVAEALGNVIGNYKKQEIEKVIDRAMKEYGEVFRKLGKE